MPFSHCLSFLSRQRGEEELWKTRLPSYGLRLVEGKPQHSLVRAQSRAKLRKNRALYSADLREKFSAGLQTELSESFLDPLRILCRFHRRFIFVLVVVCLVKLKGKKIQMASG